MLAGGPMTSAEQPLIVVFGFGAQGKAQAKNLRDAGRNVAVSVRPESPHREEILAEGFSLIHDAHEAAAQCDIAALMIPDSAQPAFLNDYLAKTLRKGTAVIFAHGFNIHYKKIIPRNDLDVILVAPLGHGGAVREEFSAGGGVACALAVHQDATGRAWTIAEDYARGISKTGPFIKSTFAEETESDLFAEQAVLCGGMNALIRAAFDTLVAKGINPQIAYTSCLKEVRALANLLYDHGIDGARARISDTARYGDLTRGPRIIDDRVRATMETIFQEIRSGAFAKEFSEDAAEGFPTLNGLLEKDREHLIEIIYADRSMDLKK